MFNTICWSQNNFWETQKWINAVQNIKLGVIHIFNMKIGHVFKPLLPQCITPYEAILSKWKHSFYLSKSRKIITLNVFYHKNNRSSATRNFLSQIQHVLTEGFYYRSSYKHQNYSNLYKKHEQDFMRIMTWNRKIMKQQ